MLGASGGERAGQTAKEYTAASFFELLKASPPPARRWLDSGEKSI
jgi:hypothetical protein